MLNFALFRAFGTFAMSIQKRLEFGHQMKEDKFTEYFENEVLRKQAYLKKEWVHTGA